MKFMKLKRRLGLPHWQVVGLLESLWLFAQLNAPLGDIGKHSNEDIAAGIDWSGCHDKLIADLTDCGWLDPCNVHRFLIHDWEDHMPTYLKGAIAKNGQQVAKQGTEHAAKQPAKQVAKQNQTDTQQPADSVQQPAPSLTLPNQTKPDLEKPPSAGADPPAIPTDRKRSHRPEDVAIPVELIDQRFSAAWSDWLADRKARGKKLTELAARQQLEDLRPLGVLKAIECIRLSIGKGWTGLFPERFTGPGSTPTETAEDRARDREKNIAIIMAGRPE